MPESVEAQPAFAAGYDAGRAEERNRLLNPSDELVAAVAKAIEQWDANDKPYEVMARAALQAAGSALDSGSAG